MDADARTYRVLILPQGRVAAVNLSLVEAAAWISTYNAIMEDQPLHAVVDEETASRAPSPGVRFPLKTPPLRRFLVRQQSGSRKAA